MARHGENIRKRKDGRWEGRYVKGRNRQGKAVLGYVYAYSYTDAKKKLTIKKAETACYALNEDHPSFEEVASSWLCTLKNGVKEYIFY